VRHRSALRPSTVTTLGAAIGLALSIATALAGTVLGLVSDGFVAGGDAADLTARMWTTLATAALTSGTFLLAWRLWRRRSRLLRQRGTLYAVDSPMARWSEDDKTSYLTQARSEFAQVIHVAGPRELYGWQWPSTKAGRWDAAVDDLVQAFRTVKSQDDQDTPFAVVCWLPWPVAMGWAARVVHADRQLLLAIRPRRSTAGRVGRHETEAWKESPQTFERAIERPTGTPVTVNVMNTKVTLAVSPGMPAEGVAECALRVLLIRTSSSLWSHPAGKPVAVRNATGRPWGANLTCELRQWTCLPAERFHKWEDLWWMAEEIAQWIVDNAHDDVDLALGALMPQELGLAIGIVSSFRFLDNWPEHLWSLHWDGEESAFVASSIDLGRAGVRTVAQRNEPR
jgi:hypothetical protein